MGSIASDIWALVCWLLAGVGFVWSGLIFADHYSPSLAADNQLFYLFGVALGALGVLLSTWLVLSLIFAVIASCCEATGRYVVAERLGRFVPSFLRRLAGATVALCLVASPGVAVDLSFQDTVGDQQTENSRHDQLTQEPDPKQEQPPSSESQAEPESSPTPSYSLPSTEPAPRPVPEAAPSPIPTQSAGTSLRSGADGPIDLRLVQPAPRVAKPPKRAAAPRTTQPREESETERRIAPMPPPSPVPGQQRRAENNSSVVVLRGDSLWSIVRSELGPAATDAEVHRRLLHWYHHNRSVIGADPNLIYPGTVLAVPIAKEP